MISHTARAEWRAHWRVVLGTFIGMALAYPAWPFVQSQFVGPLQAEFGWSRGAIAAAFGSTLLIAWCSPLYGRLIDRFGVRPVLITCLVLLTIGYVVLANFAGSYTAFFVTFLLVLFVGMGTTGISFTRPVASWFEASRGTALAVARIGMSLAGALMPIVMFHVIASYGWRAGYWLLAAIVACLSLPVTVAWVRDRRPSAEEAERGRRAPELRTWLAVVRDRRVMLLCLAAACTYGPCIGVLTSLQPLLTSKGIGAETSANMAALISISVLAGTLITGLLVDRVWAPLVGCIFTLVPVAGCLLLTQPDVAGWQAGLAIMLIGLAQGAEIDVVAFMTARYFGMKAFSLVYGLGVLVISLATTAFAFGFGRSFDNTGSYNTALLFAGGTFALGAVCYLLVGPYPAKPGIKGLEAPDAEAGPAARQS